MRMVPVVYFYLVALLFMGCHHVPSDVQSCGLAAVLLLSLHKLIPAVN